MKDDQFQLVLLVFLDKVRQGRFTEVTGSTVDCDCGHGDTRLDCGVGVVEVISGLGTLGERLESG